MRKPKQPLGSFNEWQSYVEDFVKRSTGKYTILPSTVYSINDLRDYLREQFILERRSKRIYKKFIQNEN